MESTDSTVDAELSIRTAAESYALECVQNYGPLKKELRKMRRENEKLKKENKLLKKEIVDLNEIQSQNKRTLSEWKSSHDKLTKELNKYGVFQQQQQQPPPPSKQRPSVLQPTSPDRLNRFMHDSYDGTTFDPNSSPPQPLPSSSPQQKEEDQLPAPQIKEEPQEEPPIKEEPHIKEEPLPSQYGMLPDSYRLDLDLPDLNVVTPRKGSSNGHNLDPSPSRKRPRRNGGPTKRIDEDIDQDLIHQRRKTVFPKSLPSSSLTHQLPTPSQSGNKNNKTLDGWLHKGKKYPDTGSDSNCDFIDLDDNKFVEALLSKEWNLNDFSPKASPLFHQPDVVRGAKRWKLPGRACRQCREYQRLTANTANATGSGVNKCKHEKIMSLNHQMKQNINKTSRHRGEFGSESPPPDFWDQELVDDTMVKDQWASHTKKRVLARLAEAIEHGNYKLRDKSIQERMDKVDWQRVQPELLDALYDE